MSHSPPPSSEIKYDIVEQDLNWSNFFKQTYQFNEQIQIHIRDVIETDFSSGTKTYVYEDFDSVVKDKKYNLISIDGPYGSDVYSRIDVLDYIPSILSENFVIMIDDFNRIGEQNMVRLLKDKLEKNNISYAEATYTGMKNICIVVSEQLRFFTTM